MAAKKKQSFEQGLEALEALVSRMEEGELPLEESIAAFEQGMELYKALHQQLDQAKARVEMLQPKEDGSDLEEAEIVTFEVDDDEQ